MASFRFCRPDDAELLVEAVAKCYAPYVSHHPKLDVGGLTQEMNGLGLWTSSCMLVTEGSNPIGVLTAARRDHGALITRLGIHPDYRGKGYAKHMLSSLAEKMKILGPHNLSVELPARPMGQGKGDIPSFFEKQGFVGHLKTMDRVVFGSQSYRDCLEWVIPLDEGDLLDLFAERSGSKDSMSWNTSWIRQPESLTAINRNMRRIGIAGMNGIEAYACFVQGKGKLYTGPQESFSQASVEILGMEIFNNSRTVAYRDTLLTYMADHSKKEWGLEGGFGFHMPQCLSEEVRDAGFKESDARGGEAYRTYSLELAPQ